MLYFDPGYILVMVLGMALSGGAALLTRTTFDRYSRFGTRRGLTGAQVAQAILRENGIHDVRVEPVPGRLSDHYDPASRTLRLSEPVYASQSMAAIGVAAHEVGHAIQHASGYAPLKFRSAWVPVASTGSRISMFVILAAFFLGGAATFAGKITALVGVALFGTVTLFTLITLPVELDASKRAMVSLEHGGFLTPDELSGARKVLGAAAMTYVAAAATSLLQLLYWAMRLGLIGGRQRD